MTEKLANSPIRRIRKILTPWISGHENLKQYGTPQPPDVVPAKIKAFWERIVLRNYQYITPQYNLTAPVAAVDTSVQSSSLCSGAAKKIDKLEKGTAITVAASWIVPNVYPPDQQQSSTESQVTENARALTRIRETCRCTVCTCYLCCQGDCSDYPDPDGGSTGSGNTDGGSTDGDGGGTDGGTDGGETDNDGTYPCYNWVGIDCTTTSNGLRAGTRSEVTVEDGEITGQSATFWVQWQDTQDITNVSVQPGDLVTVLLTCNVGDTTAAVVLTNDSAQSGASTSLTSKTKLAGKSVEWLMQGPATTSGDPLPFPNLGASVFYNVVAKAGDDVIGTTTNATLVEVQTKDWVPDIDPATLMVYGKNYGPS